MFACVAFYRIGRFTGKLIEKKPRAANELCLGKAE
jgi:hypothetical protein